MFLKSMKKQEKDTARALRKEGLSINEIAQKVGVSKASVSLWVRDIELSTKQRSKLNANGFSVDVIEKRRIKRIRNTREKHQAVITEAKRDVGCLTRRELFLVGTALYWGEGGKTERGMARISNSDPLLIQLMMRFFLEICSVEPKKFRGHVHTFSHLNAKKAERYWSSVSGIPQEQFYKTYSKPSVASEGKMDSLPYGTFQIYVCDTTLFFRIKGWVEALGEVHNETK